MLIRLKEKFDSNNTLIIGKKGNGNEDMVNLWIKERTRVILLAIMNSIIQIIQTVISHFNLSFLVIVVLLYDYIIVFGFISSIKHSV